MITYPIKFQGSSQASDGIKASWDTQATGSKLRCSVPKEFEGGGDFASPEDYFLMAVMNCFVATFKVYASYSKFPFRDIKVSAWLTVDKNDEGKPCMKRVDMNIQLNGVANQDRARLLVDKVLANGFILQSLKTELAIDLNFGE